MLAQTLWGSEINLKKEHGGRFIHKIPQGALVFVASLHGKFAIVIHEETKLIVPTASLKLIQNEQDIIPQEDLELKYHNKRNSNK
jgi:hypothetical protein